MSYCLDSATVADPTGPESPPNREGSGFGTPVLVSHSLLSLLDDVPIRTWFPKENLFSFQTATTTMQA